MSIIYIVHRLLKWRKYKKMIKSILIYILIWAVVLCIFVPISIILLSYKLLVILIARVLFPSLHPISFTEIPVTIDSSKNTPNINTTQVWFLEGQLSTESFRSHFQNCFLNSKENRKKYNNLYCYITTFLGYQFKKSVEDINIEEHINDYALPPGEKIESFVGKWMVTDTYNEHKPLWQVLLLDYKGNTAVLLKMHHSLVDGYSFVHIVEKLSGEKAPYMVKQSCIPFLQKVKIIAKAPKLILDVWKDMAFSENAKNPFINSVINGDEEWFISFSTLDLDLIKRIRKITKTHFVSVMISIQYGALRRLLLENTSVKDLPEYLWLTNSLPWPNHPKETLCNHWTCGMFKIPLKTSDPLKRLKETEAAYLDFIQKDIHKAGFLVQMPFFWLLPVKLVRTIQAYDLAMINSSSFFASLVCPNEKPLSLLGREVKDLYLPVLTKDIIPQCAMYAVTTTIHGKLELSVNASSKLVPRQDSLDRLTRKYFKEEAELLFLQTTKYCSDS